MYNEPETRSIPEDLNQWEVASLYDAWLDSREGQDWLSDVSLAMGYGYAAEAWEI